MIQPPRPPSRRLVLGLAVGAPLALSATVAVAADPVCANPDDLSDSDLSLRASLKFQEVAQDPARPCAKCGFFTPAVQAPSCGTCGILHGPVSAVSSCRSWAGK